MEAIADRSLPSLITCHMTCADSWRALQVLWLNTRAASASDTPSRWPPPGPTWRCTSPGIWILLEPFKRRGEREEGVRQVDTRGLIHLWTRTYHRAARRHFLHAQHHFLVKCGWPEDLRHQASTARLLRREFSSTEQHLIGLPVGHNKMVMGSIHFSLRSETELGR